MTMLLVLVMCWVGERTSLPEATPSGGPAVERSHDSLPLGKLADSNADGQAAEAELADDSDVDALLVSEAAVGFASIIGFGPFATGRELNDWRVRSSIGARGPPLV
jgi:hypothetical protein